MSEVQLHKLTRREFRERMQAHEIEACIIPTGAIEQHLEHLEMEHDWRTVSELSIRVARELSPRVIVAAGVMVGISEHHMTHRGTLSVRPSTFLAILGDLIDSVVRSGIKNILVLNGHGGNVAPCRAVWDQFLREFQVNLQFLPYWELLTPEDAKLLESELIPGHAQEFETAIAKAIFPDNVRPAAVADQADPTPAFAKESAGAELFQTVVSRVCHHVQQMIQGDSVAEIPPYFP